MEEENSKYFDALKGIPIPTIVLDKQWHKLFEGRKKPQKVKKLEQELNDLIKQQGQNNTNIKDYKKLKAKLMEEIVVNMEQSQADSNHKKVAKKMEDNQRLIKEINEKLEECEEEKVEFPHQIREKNMELMVASMEACYRFLHRNGEDIQAIEEWIADVRTKLNKNILIKQEREAKNLQIYTYMHHILGPKVLDVFDMNYLKGWKPPEDPDKAEQAEEAEKSEAAGKQAQAEKPEAASKSEKAEKENGSDKSENSENGEK